MNPAYTPNEVVENFQALIRSWDFSAQVKQLGIGPLQIMRRKQMLLEFRGLFVGLWRLALARSFPDDGEEIFELWLATCSQERASKNTRLFVERARQYAEMLTLRGNTDFSEASRHVASFFPLSEEERKRAVLKISLDLRRIYNFIFERMI